uniref:Ig-like domain-containing surface protein n=1 Tax=Eubacterium cellulosolvens (strain ATCC 43171 / JCM 9499 / 6) TaxID=633697 RepID=I5AUY3_EUBC6
MDKADPYKAVLVSYHGNENELIIPEYIEGRKITEVASGAFKDCKNITSLEITASVETLNCCLFGTDGSSALVNLKLPEKNIALSEPSEVSDSDGHSMKPGPFAFCENLKKIEIPEGTTTIPAYFFGGCSGLQEITLPPFLKEISMDAFADCSSLKKVVISGVSTTVKSTNLYNPGDLKIYAYKDSEAEEWMKQNAPSCFVDLATVEERIEPFWEIKVNEEDQSTAAIVKYEGNDVVLDIPEYIDGKKITGIVEGAFESCTSIQCVKLDASLEYLDDDGDLIGDYWQGAFASCPNLTKAIIKEGTTEISTCLFGGSKTLNKVVIPDTVTEIYPYAFYECESLENVKLPESLTYLSISAFVWCQSLTNVQLPSSLDRLEVGVEEEGWDSSDPWGPFAGCKNIKKVEISEGVTKVPDGLFAGCSDLEEIVIPETVTSIGGVAFTKITATIYGYTGTYAEKWAEERGLEFISLGEKTITATPTPSVANEYSVKISGRSLSLTGKIGASVYVQGAEELLKDEDAYATITVGDRDEKILLKDLSFTEVSGKKALILETDVKACETNGDIFIRLYSSDGRLVPITDEKGRKSEDGYTFTVSDTASVYMNSKAFPKKLKKLAEAILNYGIYTQKLQNYKADELTATDDLSNIKKSSLKNYEVKKNGKVSGVSYAGFNLELKEDTGLAVYFKTTADPSKLAITVDGKKVDVETEDLECGKLISVKINGISAQKLSSEREVIVSDGEREMSVKLSALSWSRAVLYGKNYSKEIVDLAKMLYRYSSAADAYFEKKSSCNKTGRIPMECDLQKIRPPAMQVAGLLLLERDQKMKKSL